MLEQTDEYVAHLTKMVSEHKKEQKAILKGSKKKKKKKKKSDDVSKSLVHLNINTVFRGIGIPIIKIRQSYRETSMGSPII